MSPTASDIVIRADASGKIGNKEDAAALRILASWARRGTLDRIFGESICPHCDTVGAFLKEEIVNAVGWLDLTVAKITETGGDLDVYAPEAPDHEGYAFVSGNFSVLWHPPRIFCAEIAAAYLSHLNTPLALDPPANSGAVAVSYR